MGKWELTMNPVQEWCDESEDGVVYGVTLRRTPLSPGPGGNDACPGSGFVKYRTCKVRRLKAATLERLVSHLLEPGCQDYSRIFLSTYRTFTSTTALIQMLFQRDNAASDMDNSECYRSPVLTLVQTWLDEYSEDFRSPPSHPPLRLLMDHLQISAAVSTNMRCQPNFCSLAGQAEELLKRFQKEEMETTRHSAQADVEQEEGSSGTEGLDCEPCQEASDIMDFSVHAIAEQLTRLDSALFVKLVPYQCLGCVWSQRDKKPNMSPTTRATIAQFNAVTNRVITSLLCRPTLGSSSPPSSRRTPTSPAQRARIIEKWIRVAQECRQLRNLSSLRAILSALQSNAVHRLRKTWAAVNRESMATFDNLWETFPDENCVLSNREMLVEDRTQPAMDNVSPKWCPISKQMQSTSSAVVPYLGTYLTVLTMLDTALPDNLEGELINFEKRRREFEILSQIHLLQASCAQYNLPQHPRIDAWLREHKMLTDLGSYELSIRLEPPVDLCSPGPWSHRTLTKKLTSLLTVNDSSKKVLADQISVSSSGSSGSEMEDLSSNGGCSIRLQPLSLSCNNVSETFSSSSSSSSSCSTSSPCSSADSSMEAPTSSSSCSSSSSQPDLCAQAAVHHLILPECSSPKRSVSMTMLPVYNRQVADSCIVRVSVDLGTNNGNMYKSILLTSQDKTAQVIQRALEKHHLEHMSRQEFTLTQLISPGRELLIPDKANVFYAMSTAANFDFVLRKFSKGQKTPLRATCSLGRYTK